MSRSSFSKVFPVSKTTQETLSIESFPSEVQSTLSEAFDKDGNGIIDCQELVDAANLYTQTKAANSLLRKGVCFAAALSVCLVGAIAGLTYGIVDANKDTHVNDSVCWADWIFERSQSRFANRDSRGLGAVTYARGTITRELGTATWWSENHTCKAIEI